MTGSAPLPQALTYGPSAEGATPVDVVVLSKDDSLFDSVQRAVGHEHPIWTVRSSEDAVEMLVRGSCGVLLVDLASVVFQPDRLVRNVVEQFPDVVVCVAGGRDDEPLMAPLISEGFVFRFMHRPLSPRRAGMFLLAAIRHHLDKRNGSFQRRPEAGNLTVLPSRLAPLKWIGGAVGVAIFVMLLSIYVDDRPAAPMESASANILVPAETVAPTARTVPVEPAVPTARARQPLEVAPVVARPADGNAVLAAAQAAYDANRLEAPAGTCALDLYKAVLSVDPGNSEARTGYSRTIDRMLINARIALNGGNPTEARRLVERALAADPKRSTSLLLARQIEQATAPPPEPAPTTPPATPASLASAPTTVAPRRAVPPTVVPVSRIAPPPATAPTTPPAPIVVRPDPLAARIINPQDTTAAPRPRIPGRAVPQLPIAGYVKSSPATDATSAAKAETGEAAPSPPGPTLPADSFEKLVVTDPVYPIEALRSRTQGWVQLEFTITTSGAVRDIAVIEAEPKGVFDRSATDALGRWRFQPRYVNGQPIAQRSSITVYYNLEG